MVVSLTIPHGFDYDEYSLFAQAVNYSFITKRADGSIDHPYQGSYAGPNSMNTIVSNLNMRISNSIQYGTQDNLVEAIVSYSYTERVRTGFTDGVPQIIDKSYRTKSQGGSYARDKFIVFDIKAIIGNYTNADALNGVPVPQIYWPNFDDPSSITNIPSP